MTFPTLQTGLRHTESVEGLHSLWNVTASNEALCSIHRATSRSEAATTTNLFTQNATRWLLAYFQDPTQSAPCQIPLDVRFATPFEKSVWEVIATIPTGKSMTYSEIAVLVGNKQASRAVGAAVGKNPFAIVIPCHRVLGKNGALTGYRWGEETKRRLLMHEGHPLFRQTSLFTPD